MSKKKVTKKNLKAKKPMSKKKVTKKNLKAKKPPETSESTSNSDESWDALRSLNGFRLVARTGRKLKKPVRQTGNRW